MNSLVVVTRARNGLLTVSGILGNDVQRAELVVETPSQLLVFLLPPTLLPGVGRTAVRKRRSDDRGGRSENNKNGSNRAPQRETMEQSEGALGQIRNGSEMQSASKCTKRSKICESCKRTKMELIREEQSVRYDYIRPEKAVYP